MVKLNKEMIDNVGDRVMLTKKVVVSKKKSLSLSQSSEMLLAKNTK